MSNITFDEIGPLLTREISAKRTSLLAVFTCVALAFLVLAMLWQNSYESRVQLIVDQRAEAGSGIGAAGVLSRDRAATVRELLVSDEIVDRVLADTELVSADASPGARDAIRQAIVRETQVVDIDGQRLDIVVQQNDPATAVDVANRYAELLLDYSRQADADAPRAVTLLSDARIYRAADYPRSPTGLRFVHIAVLGLVLAIALPFVALAVFLKLDPRIRTASAITDVLELPLLASVPHLQLPTERSGLFRRTGAIVAVIVAVVLLYCVAVYYKYNEVLSSQGVHLA